MDLHYNINDTHTFIDSRVTRLQSIKDDFLNNIENVTLAHFKADWNVLKNETEGCAWVCAGIGCSDCPCSGWMHVNFCDGDYKCTISTDYLSADKNYYCNNPCDNAGSGADQYCKPNECTIQKCKDEFIKIKDGEVVSKQNVAELMRNMTTSVDKAIQNFKAIKIAFALI